MTYATQIALIAWFMLCGAIIASFAVHVLIG